MANCNHSSMRITPAGSPRCSPALTARCSGAAGRLAAPTGALLHENGRAKQHVRQDGARWNGYLQGGWVASQAGRMRAVRWRPTAANSGIPGHPPIAAPECRVTAYQVAVVVGVDRRMEGLQLLAVLLLVQQRRVGIQWLHPAKRSLARQQQLLSRKCAPATTRPRACRRPCHCWRCTPRSQKIQCPLPHCSSSASWQS